MWKNQSRASSHSTLQILKTKVLKERFRHPYHVAHAYKERLNVWPPIKEGDGMSLQQFSDFLVLCEQAMKILKYMEGHAKEDKLEVSQSHRREVVLFCHQGVKIRGKGCHLSWCGRIRKGGSSIGYWPSILTWSPKRGTITIITTTTKTYKNKEEFGQLLHRCHSLRGAASTMLSFMPILQQLPPRSGWLLKFQEDPRRKKVICSGN